MPDYRYLPSQLAESLRGSSVAVRRPVRGSRTGLHRSPMHGTSVEFAEYRDYTPGDPTNLIDWAVYARSDRYLIRKYHEETNLRAHVLLDVSASLGFRDEGPMTKLDVAAFLAAGVMFMLLNQGDSVGLVTFDSRIRDVFKPVGTSEELRPLLLHLETLRAAGESRIEPCLHEAAGLIGPPSLVIVISDFLADADTVVRGMRHFHHDGHNLIVLHISDRGERRLGFAGVAELRDLETRARLVVEVDEMREAYQAAVEEHLQKLRHGCTECMADYYLVDTADPIDETLHRLGGRSAASHV
jgi:uncharacterized protein (DUF58 family)